MPRRMLSLLTRSTVLAVLAVALGDGATAHRVACVGDSITVGARLAAGESYPDVLAGVLGAGWTVGNFGEHGTTMIKAPSSGKDSYWMAPAFARSQAFAPDVVVIMLGSNDAKPANWRAGANTYEADYRAMIALYAGLPGQPRVLVALPPPVFPGPSSGIDPRSLETGVLPATARVAAEAGVAVIDVHAAFAADPRRYFGKGDGRDLGDGVHPNAAGARLIAATVAAALLPAGAGVAVDALADGDVVDSLRAEPGPNASERTPMPGTSALPGPAVRATGCQVGGGHAGGGLLLVLIGCGALIRRTGGRLPRPRRRRLASVPPARSARRPCASPQAGLR
jgi:lysophospholipase L1-like esterase